jgi:hypothetical protein
MSQEDQYRRLANRHDAALRFNLPKNVKDEIKRRGIQNGRTMSAEVLNRVVDTLIGEDEKIKFKSI